MGTVKKKLKMIAAFLSQISYLLMLIYIFSVFFRGRIKELFSSTTTNYPYPYVSYRIRKARKNKTGKGNYKHIHLRIWTLYFSFAEM